MQTFTSLPVYRLKTPQQFHVTAPVNRSFIEKQCSQGQFHLSVYFVVNKEKISVKLYFLATTVYENKVIKKKAWLICV